MCRDSWTPVRVRIPADLACEGVEKWKDAQIDSCIAGLVEALQAGGVDMRGSCCGHGVGRGSIDLHDGRRLLVLSEAEGRALLAGGPSPGFQQTEQRVLSDEVLDNLAIGFDEIGGEKAGF